MTGEKLLFRHLRWTLVGFVLTAAQFCTGLATGAQPAILAYSAYPNPYLTDHARDVARLYDGLIFPLGDWEEAIPRRLGVAGTSQADSSWYRLIRENLRALVAAGVTENLLDVYFSSGGTWPSQETLLSADFTRKMARYFGRLAEAARDLGFRGVCIDLEYPYPRYELDHPQYRYGTVTPGRLLEAARLQGRAVGEAILRAYPDAVVWTLPGVVRTRPIARAFWLGLLDALASRDAPGGLHLGMEFTYSLLDPATVLASSRAEELALSTLVDSSTFAYWRKRCSVAPGVWPLHMVETGGKNYPVRPWKKEVAELRQQLALLSAVAKRYVWTYSGTPLWYRWTPELGRRYGLREQKFRRPDVDVADWQALLQRRSQLDAASPFWPWVKAIRSYDRGELSGEELCWRFGTPARWWTLIPLSNPRSDPAFSAPEAMKRLPDTQTPYIGRDGVVRWFVWDNFDPRGAVSPRAIVDWWKTDSTSAVFVATVCSDRPRDVFVEAGWDDGLLVCVNGDTVLDRRDYPRRGHGWHYRDRYIFEDRAPVHLPSGCSTVRVLSLNSHGNWVFSIRFVDENGLPVSDLRFSLPNDPCKARRRRSAR